MNHILTVRVSAARTSRNKRDVTSFNGIINRDCSMEKLPDEKGNPSWNERLPDLAEMGCL
ncbi:hypothetical protein FRX31_003518, partial [Thalictrum thalictroides]